MDAAVVTFQYSQGAFTDDFVDWVARFGARTPFPLESGATVNDYALKSCGAQPGQNADVIRRSLEAQGFGIAEDGTVSPSTQADTIMLPPCLPVAIEETRGNISLPGDSLSVITGPKVQWSGNPLIEQMTLDQLFPTGTGGGSQLPVFVQDDAFDYSDIQLTTKDYLASVTPPELSDSEVAFNVFLTGKSLEESGVDPGIAKQTVFQSLGEINPAYDPEQVEKFATAYDNAMIRYGSQPQITAQDLWRASGQQVQHAAADPVGTPQFDWLAPFPDVKRPTQLDAGEIIFTKVPVQQSISIPIDGSLLQKGAASATEYVAAEIPPISDDPGGSTAPDVIPFSSTSVDALDAGTCSPSANRWGGSQFAQEFLATALRNRLHSHRYGKSQFNAKLVIIDSGLVRTSQRDPFRDNVFTITGTELENQLAGPELLDRRDHGTAVAGVALGGPDLWGLPAALGLNVTIMPRRIYDRSVDVQGNFYAQVNFNRMYDALGGDADVYNLSFAASRREDMQRFARYRGDRGKLLVIAAGNNYMNTGSEGADLNDSELFPQSYGGDDVDGSNIVTVAAVDADGSLALYSNYSTERVAIAAPGCGVESWAPGEGDAAMEVRQFAGTSFSAPIVAYVATLVHALAPSDYASSQWTRLRLLASADLVPELAGIGEDVEPGRGVEDGRLLNPVKAIAIYEDVVELNDAGEPLRFGHLEVVSDSLTEFCHDKDLPPDARLLKVAHDPTDPAGRRLVFYYSRLVVEDEITLLGRGTCEPKSPTLAMTRSDTGQTEILSFADIKDIVFGMN